MPDFTIKDKRRPAFVARPWVKAQDYDLLASTAILHCDAYLYYTSLGEVLSIEWREGGTKLIADDHYLIEPDGLTELWDTPLGRRFRGYWRKDNNAIMARVHVTVLELTRSPLWARYGRVSFQAHYVLVRETDCEPGGNQFGKPKPDTPKRPRGRPRKDGTLPGSARETVRRIEPWEVWTPGTPIPDGVL